MQRLPLCIAIAGLLSACAPKADLDKANVEIARLSTEATSLRKLNEELRATIADLERRQAALQGQFEQATQQLSVASQQLSSAEQQLAKKPNLPVAVAFRPAALGPGYVAMFSTTIKQAFPILVTFKSRALGTSQQFRLNLHDAGIIELGYAQGATLEPQDELVLENQNYSPVVIKVVAKK